jgi:HEAT repeat protein
LALFGPKAVVAVPALIDALADENGSVRDHAATTLGKIGPGAKAAVPALTALRDALREGGEPDRAEIYFNYALELIDGK